MRKNDGVCKRLSRKSAARTSVLPTIVVMINTAKPRHCKSEISGLTGSAAIDSVKYIVVVLIVRETL